MIYYISNNIMDDHCHLGYCLTDNVWEFYFTVDVDDILIMTNYTWYEL